jgi:ketosteroid isomerase-like protein
MKRSLMMGGLLVLAAVFAPAQAQSQRGVVEEIRKVDRERIQAQVNADRVALDRIYADDFIGIGPSGTLRTKKEVLSDFSSGSLKFQSITTDDVRIRVYGNAAVETGLSTMKGQDAGKVVPQENRFTRVWIKQGGRWRLVSNHYSNLVKER